MPQAIPAAVTWAVSAFTSAATVVNTAFVAASGALLPGASFATQVAVANAAFKATMMFSLSAASAALLRPNTPSTGTTLDFKPDPKAPVRGAMGYTALGGNKVFQAAWGYKGVALSLGAALSLGPIDAITKFEADGAAVAFTGAQNEATGFYAADMWQKTTLGLPDDPALLPPTGLKYGNPPLTGWGAQHAAPGVSFAFWTMVLAKNPEDRDVFTNGVPDPRWIGRWMKVWDPRKDSTYPGGVGPQRRDDWRTWAWSECPYAHALAWARGHFKLNPDGSIDRTKRIAGIGAPDSAIDIPAFVEGMNIAEANAWTISGEWSTSDGKYQTFLAMLQAGGGEPISRGAQISVIVNAPRVSTYTYTRDDLVGRAEIRPLTPRRERKNTIVPRYKSEANGWEYVPAGEVTSQVYRDEDRGEPRSLEVEYTHVRSAKQAAQLAAYDLANLREGLTATLPSKAHLMHLHPGDCITVDVPELALAGQKFVVRRTTSNHGSATTTLELRAESDAKHPWALGQVENPAPSPALSAVDPKYVPPPEPEYWAVIPKPPKDGTAQPVLIVEGEVDTTDVASVLVEYAPAAIGPWRVAYSGVPLLEGKYEAQGLDPGADYWVSVRYVARNGAISDRLVSGPHTAPALVAGDTAAVGGRPVVDVLQLIDNTEQAVSDLETVYGDTASAAASAAAAAGSEAAAIQAEADAIIAQAAAEAAASDAADSASAANSSAVAASTSAANASASESAAATSATNAAGSAATATTQAGIATDSAGAAGGSASSAATSASNAASYASDAATAASAASASAVSAKVSGILAAGRFDLQQGVGALTNPGYYGPSTPDTTFQVVNDAGKTTLQLVAPETSYVNTKWVGTPRPGRTYRLFVRFRTAGYAGNGLRPYVAFLNDAYAYQSAISFNAHFDTHWDYRVRSWDYTFTEADGAHPHFIWQLEHAPGAEGGGILLWQAWWEDVTSEIAAGGSASAAATSASNAAASESAAGSSASAAAASATSAATSAGQANTYATQASNSATTAEGHAANASTSAGAAATSAGQASGSASAAAGSASNAATSATDASNSASAASASAVSASASMTGARGGAAAAFPAGFDQDDAFFSANLLGSPTSASHGAPTGSYTWSFINDGGRILRQAVFTPGTPLYAHIRPRGVLPATGGRRYRGTIRARNASGYANTAVGATFYGLSADFQTLIYLTTDYVSGGIDGYTPNLGGSWETFTGEIQLKQTLPADIAWIIFGPYSFNPGGGQGFVDWSLIEVRDITSEAAAGASASAAATQASNAAASASEAGVYASAAQGSATTASTAASDASTYASQASTSAGNAASSSSSAGTSASNAAGSAATAETHASNASASAASASASASIAAGVVSGALNSNAGFDNYPTLYGAPGGWAEYTSGSGYGRVDDGAGGYAVQIDAPAGVASGVYQASADYAVSDHQWLVMEAEVQLWSGDFTGSGFLVQLYESTFSTLLGSQQINFATDADDDGRIASWLIGRRRYSRLFQAPAGTRRFYDYAFNHWSGHGSIAAPNGLRWFMARVRKATAAEIEQQEVLPGLQATVATHSTALVELETQYALARYQVAATTPAGSAILTLLSDDFGTVAGLSADQVYFGENTFFDNATDTLRTTIGGNTRVLALGAAFGTDGTLTQWEGPSAVPFASMSRANAYFYAANTSPYLGGTAFPGLRFKATASNPVRTGTRTSAGQVTTDTVTVTTEGAAGAVSYAWSQIGGNETWTITAGSDATTAFRINVSTPGEIKRAQFVCVATDSGTGKTDAVVVGAAAIYNV